VQRGNDAIPHPALGPTIHARIEGGPVAESLGEKWLRLVGQLRAFLKWCLACAAYAAVSRAGRLLTYT